MKNVLFIVLDSITNNQIFNSINSKDKAPFLNNLRNKSITVRGPSPNRTSA